MFISKSVSRFLNVFFPSLVFRIPVEEKVLFLTFDDGPNQSTTGFILETLEKYNAKATFFCSGEQIEDYPELYERIVLSENEVGNHGYRHLDGFRTGSAAYKYNIERAADLIGPSLYRPPFGRLWPWQVRSIRKSYRIIIWDVMFPDYRQGLDCEKAIGKLFPVISSGSIIVMHDSSEAKENLRYILPRLLEAFKGKGFQFETIPLIN
jgi:peptidoglycan-N-acetylglucosamine deacetylase